MHAPAQLRNGNVLNSEAQKRNGNVSHRLATEKLGAAVNGNGKATESIDGRSRAKAQRRTQARIGNRIHKPNEGDEKMAQQPMCGNTSCAACKFNDLTERNECIALDQCLLSNNHCPFFTDTVSAEKSRESARKRAEKYGSLANDGTYRQQRFVRTRREEDKNGIPFIITRPDIPAWLEDLAQSGRIPMDVFSRYAAAHSD